MIFKEFAVPKRPFKRMDYKMAITFLRENNITKEDNSFYEFGEVILCIIFNNLLCLYNLNLQLIITYLGHSGNGRKKND